MAEEPDRLDKIEESVKQLDYFLMALVQAVALIRLELKRAQAEREARHADARA